MKDREETRLSSMRKVTKREYVEFLRKNDSVLVGNTRVELVRGGKPDRYGPEGFSPEEWTVWSFQDRGDWATHRGNFRGNWSPYIPRNLILKYSSAGETVCDPMAGSGTTLVECVLLGRKGVGVDINPAAAMVAMNRIDFVVPGMRARSGHAEVFTGDARNLNLVEDGTVDLVLTHPPYCSIIRYGSSSVAGDLSSMNLRHFLEAMEGVSSEAFRILKEGRYCAVLIGDTRNRRHYVPISIGVLNSFMNAGFLLKEDIIKIQHGTSSGRQRWKGHRYDFYKIGHEHLYVFRKPLQSEKVSTLKNSSKWW